jgi:hypothetical protein
MQRREIHHLGVTMLYYYQQAKNNTQKQHRKIECRCAIFC